MASSLAWEAITDRAFIEKLFGLYVGPKPLQKDFKPGFVARVGEVLGSSE